MWTFSKIVFSLVILLPRERARKAADQRRAEDDLSSLTCYWTNTVLPGAQSVSIHLRNWQWWLIFIKLYFLLHRLAARVAIKENTRSLVARFVICQFINLKCSPFLKGLPPPVRGKVWRLALNNSLNLTTQLYSILRSAYSAYSAYSGEDNIVANMKRNEA